MSINLFRVTSVLLMMPALAAAASVPAKPFELGKAPEWTRTSAGPLCGVYAACTALRLLGIEAREEDYVTSHYVGSCGGSSAAQICELIEGCGASADSRGRLSACDLRVFGGPVIANVRRNPSDDRFSHWVVAVRRDGGVAVYDGLSPVRVVSVAEFLGVWSGVGVLVGPPNQSPAQLIWLGRSSIVLACMLVLTPLWLPGSRLRTWLSQMRHTHQGSTVLATTVAAAVAGNLVFADVRNYQSGLLTASAHVSEQFDEGSLDDVVDASSSQTALLVDARYPRDFEFGSIPAAVNIPVSASGWEIKEYLRELDRDTPVVVFCQSRSCHYDESVARQLLGLGFTDVTVSDKGWYEYSLERKEKNEDVETAANE